jgi:riboflavin kinase/FMN adenylyltransferase
MQYIKGLDEFSVPEGVRTAVTFGKFDGLHRGHQKLVNCVQKHADEQTKSVVCAFDMSHFLEARKIPVENLMTKEERRRHLDDRVDMLIDCPFTKEIYSMEAEDFIRQVLTERMHIRYIAVGTDFTFGHEKRGDFHMLQHYGRKYDFEVEVVPKELYLGKAISSTRIKEKLREGAVEDVNRMLGYPFSIDGTVVHGKQLGRTIGIPTVNIIPESVKLLPPNGVYAAKVLLDGKWYGSVTNIGTKPTVKKDLVKGIESFLFDYNGDAYEKEIRVQLFSYERPEQKFASVEELKDTMTKDIAYGKAYFAKEEKK